MLMLSVQAAVLVLDAGNAEGEVVDLLHLLRQLAPHFTQRILFLLCTAPPLLPCLLLPPHLQLQSPHLYLQGRSLQLPSCGLSPQSSQLTLFTVQLLLKLVDLLLE